MDAIDRFYKLCSLFEDDIEEVAIVLKRAGSKDRLTRITEDIQELKLKRYCQQIDIVLADPLRFMKGRQLRFEF